MLDTTKIICPLKELQRELVDSKDHVTLMKPIVDLVLEWMQVKDGNCRYPEYVGDSRKSRYLHGMYIEMELYNAAMKYKKAR